MALERSVTRHKLHANTQILRDVGCMDWGESGIQRRIHVTATTCPATPLPLAFLWTLRCAYLKNPQRELAGEETRSHLMRVVSTGRLVRILCAL